MGERLKRILFMYLHHDDCEGDCEDDCEKNSPRRDTPALDMSNPIPSRDKRRRVQPNPTPNPGTIFPFCTPLHQQERSHRFIIFIASITFITFITPYCCSAYYSLAPSSYRIISLMRCDGHALVSAPPTH